MMKRGKEEKGKGGTGKSERKVREKSKGKYDEKREGG